jgi:hypothetical protein
VTRYICYISHCQISYTCVCLADECSAAQRRLSVCWSDVALSSGIASLLSVRVSRSQPSFAVRLSVVVPSLCFYIFVKQPHAADETSDCYVFIPVFLSWPLLLFHLALHVVVEGKTRASPLNTILVGLQIQFGNSPGRFCCPLTVAMFVAGCSSLLGCYIRPVIGRALSDVAQRHCALTL